MSLQELSNIMSKLDTNEIEEQVKALEQTSDFIKPIMDKIVCSLDKSKDDPFFIADYLYQLVYNIIEPLKKLLYRSENNEIKILISLLFLKIKTKLDLQIVISLLLEAINTENYAILAANCLAEAKIKEVSEKILARLYKCKTDQIDLIVSLLGALQKLDGKLPQDLEKRFKTKNIPWQIQTLVNSMETENIGGNK